MKNLIKETIKNFEELKENLTYDKEENYCNLVNIAIDYDNEAQDDLYLYDTIQELCNFVDEEILQQLIKENAKDGLSRLRYFINNTYDDTIYKLDGYENLENVDNSDFEYCIDECIEKLKTKLEELENEKIAINIK